MSTLCGDRMREQRDRLGVSQDSLGKAIGFKNGRNINNYERGERQPCLEDLVKIANALSCTTDYLLGHENAPSHEAANIIDQTGLPASMIADLQRQKKDIDFLEAREKAGLPTDYPFEFDPGDEDFLQKARAIAHPCGRGKDAREHIAFLRIMWEESDFDKLSERFFAWDSSIVELSKAEQYAPGYNESLDDTDLKRYRFIRAVEEFLTDYERRKTGRDVLEEDF